MGHAERLKTQAPLEKLTTLAKIGAGVGAGALAAVLFIGDSYVDIMGDLHERRSGEEMEILGNERAQEMYETASPEERYAMLFTNDFGFVSVRGLKGGNGILGKFSAAWHSGNDLNVSRDIGQDCLAGSAYDTTPSEIQGRTYGEVNAVATLNVEESGTILVYPAASEASPLRFNQGTDGLLAPADAQTESTLEAYGCGPTQL